MAGSERRQIPGWFTRDKAVDYRIAGSPFGGIRQTQEMLDFCARKNILPDCEMIRMDQINEGFERMERADVRYRFVIEMASLEV